jgi:hypothetical protein
MIWSVYHDGPEGTVAKRTHPSWLMRSVPLSVALRAGKS